jgi:hypothetical protein
MLSLSLLAAGITTLPDAELRLATIAEHVRAEGPQLIVHLVNWYAYHPEDMRRTLFWNGDAGRGSDRVELTVKPLFGYYNCEDPGYQDWVLRFSRALGVTELNVDYEGGVGAPEEFSAYYRTRYWDRWFPSLLERAGAYGMKVSVMYEPKCILGRLAAARGQDPAAVLAAPGYAGLAVEQLKLDLRNICDRFTVRPDTLGNPVVDPAYRRVAGLPVIWVFGVRASGLTKDLWQRALRELGEEGYLFVLVGTTNGERVREFDAVMPGSNPWLNQLFAGFSERYPEEWQAAQQASARGDARTARELTRRYLQALAERGLAAIAPIRVLEPPANFTVMPLAIGFQDAAVRGWDLRPPVYFEPPDRTRKEPGQVFRAYLQAARELDLTWHLVCSGDDLCERTHLLIPDEEYGFSGPLAIARAARSLGRTPDLYKAIGITEEFIRERNHGRVPEAVVPILAEARSLPAV